MTDLSEVEYGAWPSPFPIELLTRGTVVLGEIQAAAGVRYWLEGRPDEAGRQVLLRRDPSGGDVRLSPEGFNVRNRVHEYGGGAYAVDGDLVPAAQFEHVVQDDAIQRDLGDGAVPDRPGPPGGQDRQPVQRPLGPQFLRYPDAGVDHQYHPEQRVLRRPDDQDHDEQGAQDRVEPRQHVGPQDLGQAAAGRRRDRVDVASVDPGPHG